MDHLEKKARLTIQNANNTIKKALELLNNKDRMYSRLGIKKGTGNRYLQKIKPSIEELRQVEQQIISQYSHSTSMIKKQYKHSINAMYRYGKI